MPLGGLHGRMTGPPTMATVFFGGTIRNSSRSTVTKVEEERVI